MNHAVVKELKNACRETGLPLRIQQEHPQIKWLRGRKAGCPHYSTVEGIRGRIRRFKQEAAELLLIDIKKGKRGAESFEVFVGGSANLRLLHADAASRRLLLRHDDVRYMLGFDQRHLFVSRVPGAPYRLEQADEALKPAEVVEAERRGLRVPRQGEWFFVPAPEFFCTSDVSVRKNHALQRPGFRSNPHVAEEYIEYFSTPYVRGAIRHAEHPVLLLKSWHRLGLSNEFTSTTGLRLGPGCVD